LDVQIPKPIHRGFYVHRIDNFFDDFIFKIPQVYPETEPVAPDNLYGFPWKVVSGHIGQPGPDGGIFSRITGLSADGKGISGKENPLLGYNGIGSDGNKIPAVCVPDNGHVLGK
jgi:hypothetical protein